jgi:hypothetical protein
MPVPVTVTLRLFFFGLMAFVQQSGKLTVALVNATQLAIPPAQCHSAVSDCPFHQHTPLLVATPDALQSGQSCTGTTAIPGLCTWSLANVDLALPDSQSSLTYAHGRGRSYLIGPKHTLPADPTEARDFTWIPSMADVKSSAATFDSRALTDRGRVISKVVIQHGTAETCHLAGLESQGEDTVDIGCNNSSCINVFRFSSIGGQDQDSPHQAIADGVLISLDVTPGSINNQSYVKLTLVPDTGANIEVDLPIVPCDSSKPNLKGPQCADVAITNMPSHADTCPSVGMDFALLFALSMQPGQICDRPVPHRIAEAVVGEQAVEYQSNLVKTLFNSMSPVVSPESRPVCPMVVYGG